MLCGLKGRDPTLCNTADFPEFNRKYRDPSGRKQHFSRIQAPRPLAWAKECQAFGPKTKSAEPLMI